MWSKSPWWQPILRSLTPAAHAAATLERYQHDQAARAPLHEASPSGSGEDDPGDVEVLSVEHFSRVQVDYYALTAACDLLSFVYVACLYQVIDMGRHVDCVDRCPQVVVRSAASLTELTNDRVIPLDYLAVLMLLFLLMVGDRLVYTLGWHAGKARGCVHVLTMVNGMVNDMVNAIQLTVGVCMSTC